MRLHKSFIKSGIPGPKPDIFSGNYYQLHFDKKLHPHQVIEKWMNEYGPVVGYFMGNDKYLVIRDVDLLKKIFIENASLFRNRPPTVLDVQPINSSVPFARDDHWKRGRRTISPVFAQNKVQSEAISKIIDSCSKDLVSVIQEKACLKEDNSFVTEMFPRIQATSLDVIAQTSLNMTSVNVHDDKDILTNAVREYFSDAQNIVVSACIYFPILRSVFTFINDYMTAGAMTDLVVKHIKEQIITADKIHSEGESTTTFLDSLLKNLHLGRLSEREVIANAHIVLLAGQFYFKLNLFSFYLFRIRNYCNYSHFSSPSPG